MNALSESVRVQCSKSYIRVYERIGDTDQYQPIPLIWRGCEMTSHKDILVQCTRCRNKHKESERIAMPSELGKTLVCPRCGWKNYYDMTPQVAWCWASGLIEMGDKEQVPEGGIVVAHGPKAFLKAY
jgi:uncharacterized paraquat-inducible protein A